MSHDVPQSLERLAVAGHGLGPAHAAGDPDDELLSLLRCELKPRDGGNLLGSGPHARKNNERVFAGGRVDVGRAAASGEEVEWR
jgi:hypothetical protein